MGLSNKVEEVCPALPSPLKNQAWGKEGFPGLKEEPSGSSWKNGTFQSPELTDGEKNG